MPQQQVLIKLPTKNRRCMLCVTETYDRIIGETMKKIKNSNGMAMVEMDTEGQIHLL